MTTSLLLATLCTVFSDPSFYMSNTRQKQVCDIMPEVLNEATKNNLDPFLLMGLITVESNWKTTAVSHAGACGLTQVMPKYTGGSATSRVKYTCKQLQVPQTGVRVGAKVLAWWIYRYGKGDVQTGLCGYFSGFRCRPPTKAGKNYSMKVLKYRDKIKRLYEAKASGGKGG